MQENNFLTAAEVGKLLNVSPRTAYRLPLKWVKVASRAKRVRAGELTSYLRSREQAK